MSGEILTHITCLNGYLIDKINTNIWTNTAQIVSDGVNGHEQCLYYPKTSSDRRAQCQYYTYATIKNLQSINQADFTISFWCKIVDISEVNLYSYILNLNGLLYQFEGNGEYLNSYINIGNGEFEVDSKDIFCTEKQNKWVRVIITRNRDILSVYLNNKICLSADLEGHLFGFSDNNTNLYIGRSSSNQYQLCDTYIDDFYISLVADDFDTNTKLYSNIRIGD